MEFSLKDKKKGDKVATYWSSGIFHGIGTVRGIRGKDTLMVLIDNEDPSSCWNKVIYFKDGLSKEGLWLTEVTEKELKMGRVDKLYAKVHDDLENKSRDLSEDQLQRIGKILNE